MKLNPEIKKLTAHFLNSWCELHWVDFANNLAQFKTSSQLSERKLAEYFKRSKSEIHRMISVAALSPELKEVCKTFDTDYHVLCLYAEAPESERKRDLREKILDGSIRRHKKAREFLGSELRAGRKKADVVVNGDGEIRCRTCGESGKLFKDRFAVDVMEYADKIKSWSRPHYKCKGN